MRQSDFFIAPARPMLPTEATRPTIAAHPGAAATLPASALGAGNHGASGFSTVFRQVQTEVTDFLAHGAPSAPDVPRSAEGQGWLGRSELAAIEAASQADAENPLRGLGGPGQAGPGQTPSQKQFLSTIQPWAEETGQRLGIAPELVAAHAALESGWGQRPLRQTGGAETNNLFGIKAGPGWHGDVSANTTTEYAHGAALKKTEHFRAYPDQAAAFRDYAQMLLDNPRFRAALNTGSNANAFAQGLARGGYATDPAYAEKLTRLATHLQSGAAAALAANNQSGD